MFVPGAHDEPGALKEAGSAIRLLNLVMGEVTTRLSDFLKLALRLVESVVCVLDVCLLVCR